MNLLKCPERILACFAIGLVFGCKANPPQDIDLKPIKEFGGYKLTEVGKIGSEEYDNDQYFGNIADVRIDDNDNIYVLDGKGFNIKVFDLEGKFIKRIELRRGQGPGEFGRMLKMRISGNRIWISDASSKIIGMDTDGKYVRSIITKGIPGDLTIIDDHLYLTKFVDQRDNRYEIYSLDDGALLKAVPIKRDQLSVEYMKEGERDSLAKIGERIFLAVYWPSRIYEFTSQGDLMRSFGRENSSYHVTMDRDPITNVLRFPIGTLGIFPLNDKYLIHLIREIDFKTWKMFSYFDVYTLGGKWFCTVPAQEFNEAPIRVADGNENGYLVIDCSEPYPSVKIYSLRIDQNPTKGRMP